MLMGVSPLRAQSSMIVLTLPASARAAAGGDASLLATDASALFYGAQHLPSEPSVSVSTGTWIGSAQLASVAYSTPSRWQPAFKTLFGIGVQALDYGSAEEVVPDPLWGGTRGTATGGRVGGSEVAMTVAMRQQMRRLRFGFAVSYLRQQVADLAASAITMSVSEGVTVRGWDAEFSVEHASGPQRNPAVRTLSVPSTTRGSVATPAWRLAGGRWRALAEYRTTLREGRTSVFGVEGSFHTSAGWQLQARGAALAYSDETVRAPWTAGGSAAKGNWSLDYAYQGFGAFGAVHRVGLSWRALSREK